MSLNRKGFTIVEILVTFGIMAMLSGVMLLYSRSSENMIALLRDQSKILSVFSRAKSFSLQTYVENSGIGDVCGYGVHVNKEENSFIFFRDLNSDCSESDNVYTENSVPDEMMEKTVLSDAIRIRSLDASDVLFIPPDPLVIITVSPGQTSEEMSVILETISGNLGSAVKLNKSGQITVHTLQ